MRLFSNSVFQDCAKLQSNGQVDYVTKVQRALARSYQEVVANLNKQQEMMKRYHDKKSKQRNWKAGDRVWCHHNRAFAKQAYKFAHAYFGPYVILNAYTNNTVDIIRADNREGKKFRVSTDKISRVLPGMPTNVFWDGFCQFRDGVCSLDSLPGHKPRKKPGRPPKKAQPSLAAKAE